MEVILSISFKMTAEIEIRKHKLMFCFLLRGGVCRLCIAYVVVNFLSQLIFIFPLFLGMLIYANEFKTKEK